MSESAANRFLLYQPNHGFGIELFLLETAFEIARALGRTLVIPPMPDLETTHYRRGLEHYFRLDTGWPWVSAEQYRAQYGGELGLVFQIMPEYRHEFTSAEIRGLHPVWLDNIERLTSFARMGFEAAEVRPLRVERPLRLTQLCHAFADERPAVGISYINGLVEVVNRRFELATRPPSGHDGFLLSHVPTSVSDHYRAAARTFAGGEPYAAVHWRRGQNIEQVAKILENAELPTVEAMMRAVPAGIRQVVVATDVGVGDFRHLTGDHRIRSFQHEDPQVNAVVDLALCIDADFFIGVDASTFSTYAAYVRRARGLRASTLLL